jgi:hypothetical protein
LRLRCALWHPVSHISVFVLSTIFHKNPYLYFLQIYTKINRKKIKGDRKGGGEKGIG